MMKLLKRTKIVKTISFFIDQVMEVILQQLMNNEINGHVFLEFHDDISKDFLEIANNNIAIF